MDLATFICCVFFPLVFLIVFVIQTILMFGNPVTFKAKDEDEDAFFYSAMYLSQND